MADYERPPIALTEEGDGHVATCTGCGWLRYADTKAEVRSYGKAHRCRDKDRCFICGPPIRMGDLTCPHYERKPRR